MTTLSREVESASYVLVTGGAGFIGSHLCDRLLAKGRTVWVLDNLSTGRLSNIAHLLGHRDFRFIKGDVLDAELVAQLARGASEVYHLAAVVGVRRVMQSPLQVIEDNILGTRSVLEAVRGSGKRVFIASTSEVYGKNEKVPFSEESDRVLGPPQLARWSYSTSKAVDEIMALGYAQERGVEVVIGRFFNTIGQRQTGQYGMVVPRFVEQALNGSPITVYGDGDQTRSFCDVRDTIRAVTGLMEHPDATGRPYNIGNSYEISIEELARRVLFVIGGQRAVRSSAIRHVEYREVYPHGYEEFPRRVPDLARIHGLLGWMPEWNLDETLAWIAAGLNQAMSA